MMRKLLILAIFAAAFYQYYYGFGAHMMPDIDLGEVAGDLKRKAVEKRDPTLLKLECPAGTYVAVDETLQSANCQPRTRL
ncbi:MAG: hypothetical protein CMF22_08565 [Idiomarinaceae bacterium]|uniref:hypothetical protein n=1 Tax=Pseudidiomarina aquimaris TaxID=641841 RepID=UPI000C46267A|nr:hypothetical protein [Idiomarinaceae bacterium]|tara:strand:+ start:2949 stop:3188 length:240 start_codon:yes stop_codon:yes gene_type:complete